MEDKPKILLVDNFDSFTFNLFHLLGQLDVTVDVKRNNDLYFSDLNGYLGVVIGPGPGLPSEAGRLPDFLSAGLGRLPILGVCLGMQAVLERSGVGMVNLQEVQHGSRTLITQFGNGSLFHGLPKQFMIGRYHSWGFLPGSIPTGFEITAVGEDGYVMGVESELLKFCGVQFHPESIMTEHGLTMMQNWLRSF